MSTNRLLNRILRDEERADRIEANLNVHLQSYAKNVGRIQDDFSRVVEKINTCDDRVDVLQQRHVDQESFNRAILERMQEMEATIEGQTERIVSLEEEVATLRWRKACACGEEGKKTVIATGSGEDESSELEYAEEREGDGSDSSYHSPIVTAETPLLVFGEVLPGDSQTMPADVQETCGCPIPDIVRIEDDVEMIAAPRENNTPIPIRVDELPTFPVRAQRALRGVSKPYFRSSTRRANRHAMQLGSRPSPSHHGYFMGQDLRFPCARELRAAVLRAERGVDQGRSGDVEEPVEHSSNVPGGPNNRSPSRSPAHSTTSTCYRPCSLDCGGDCLSNTPYPGGS